MTFSGKPARKPRAEPEFQNQSALFSWARNPLVLHAYPELKLLSCSLNGVKLSKAQAGKAKASGMLKGEWDIKLPVARGCYHGLIIEMKAGKNKLTDEQIEYGDLMGREGWAREACWSWDAARTTITSYLALGPFVWTGSNSTPMEEHHGRAA